MRFYLKRGLWYMVLSLGLLVGLFGLLQQFDVLPKTSVHTREDLYRVQGMVHGNWKRPQPKGSLLKVFTKGKQQTWVRDQNGLHLMSEDDGGEREEFGDAEKGDELKQRRHRDHEVHKKIPFNITQDGNSVGRIWPDPSRHWDDRIISQLQYVPELYRKTKNPSLKKIFVAGGSSDPMGQEYFKRFQCPVDACLLTDRTSESETADAVLYGLDGFFPKNKPPNQIWILYLLESPINTGGFDGLANKINWTATYRRDSTLVAPYEKFVYHKNVTSVLLGPSKNFARGKTKLVAWFVSNCGARNQRMEFAEELRKHIQVDIYGYCGNMTCPRYNNKCSKMLSKDYKFYLSFENSNCQDYITEKFYQNALWNEVVPIVMGARQEDYLVGAPPHSFIHTEDFQSPKDLAAYLLLLHQNDHLYNEYHQWRSSGHFVNTKFWCRVCALLHDDSAGPTWYENVDRWWRNDGVCTTDKWDREQDLIRKWDRYF